MKLWLLPCLAAALMAADVSGKWTGNVEVDDPTGGSTINAQVRAELRQKAGAVTGTIGRQEDQEAESIQNAKLDGKRLTFEVSSSRIFGVFGVPSPTPTGLHEGPVSPARRRCRFGVERLESERSTREVGMAWGCRSEEHTSELQSLRHL